MKKVNHIPDVLPETSYLPADLIEYLMIFRHYIENNQLVIFDMKKYLTRMRC